MLNDDLISFGPGSSGAPIDGGAGGGGSGIDLQDVGGAIEGWMRKMAKRATTAIEANAATATAKGNAGVQGMGMGGGAGDLIELVDAFEIGDGEEARLADDSVLVADRTDTGTSGRSSGDIRGRRRVRGSSSKSDKDD
jgi:hypothetical protein